VNQSDSHDGYIKALNEHMHPSFREMMIANAVRPVQYFREDLNWPRTASTYFGGADDFKVFLGGSRPSGRGVGRSETGGLP
jgi:hypothetical protein